MSRITFTPIAFLIMFEPFIFASLTSAQGSKERSEPTEYKSSEARGASFTLSIAPKTKADSPLSIIIRFKNDGEEELKFFPDSTVGQGFRIKVATKEKEMVPVTRYGAGYLGPASMGSHGLLKIGAGDSREIVITNLSRAIDLSLAGDYILDASCRVRFGDGLQQETLSVEKVPFRIVEP